ncbi:MAG: DUF5658 family protein [Armatimonadota bacterium]
MEATSLGPTGKPLLHRTVSGEGTLITFICLADLITTLYWVWQGIAWEGNPVLVRFLEMGTVPFIVAKMVTFVPAVIAAEWYRPRNPVLITKVMRWVIVCYLVGYVAGVFAHSGRVVEFYRHLLFG